MLNSGILDCEKELFEDGENGVESDEEGLPFEDAYGLECDEEGLWRNPRSESE